MKRTATLFCIVFAIAANLFTFAKTQVTINDSFALVDLYNNTNAANWNNNTNWLTANPVGT